MNAGLGPVLPGAGALGTYADHISDEADREEAKLLKARKANRNEQMIDSARTKIEQRRIAADENLEAAQDKAKGTKMGSLFGIFLAVIAIVVAVVVPGIGTMAGAALIGLGAVLMGTGTALGGAIGAGKAKDNEEAAAEATEQADAAELMEKLLEKEVEDDNEAIRQLNQQMQQRWQDARQRESAENRVFLRS